MPTAVALGVADRDLLHFGVFAVAAAVVPAVPAVPADDLAVAIGVTVIVDVATPVIGSGGGAARRRILVLVSVRHACSQLSVRAARIEPT